MDLLFWYCGNCNTLDARDPAMNIALLMLLAGYNVDVVVIEVGYKMYKQAIPYMSSLVILKERLYHHSGEIFKEVV